MTVSTEVSHDEYTGNGVTTSFPYRFRIIRQSHMLVRTADLDGNESTLILGTDYTITGTGSYSGGNVVLTNALPIGWRIALERNMPLVQETDLRNQGRYFAEVHEDAFDYLTMLMQKVAGWFSLSLRKPSWISNYYDAQGNKISNVGDPVNAQDAATKGYVDSEVGTANSNAEALFVRTLRVPGSYIPPLPGAAARAGNVLTFDSAGNPIVVVPASGSAADVLSKLGSGDGFGLVGQAGSFAELRHIEPIRNGQRILLRRHSQLSERGGGVFYYDESDTTTVDNDCTVVVTENGQRWKREYTGNIQAAWAGVQYVDETNEPQDIAFKNLLLASSVDSPTGYPNKIIEDKSGRRIKLAERHHVRGGTYNNNDTIGNTQRYRSSRFGIDASFVLDGGGGFFFVQMINPLLHIQIDNSNVELVRTPTIDDYAIRCECLVITPDIKWKFSQYPGTCYYQLGKYGAAADVEEIWPDLPASITANYGGMTNCSGGSINIATCGRGFFWKAGGAGFGHIYSIWEQACKSPSYFYDLQDFTFTTFETYIATVTSDSITKAGDFFEQCGGHFGKLLTGQGGLPNVAFYGGSSVDIGHLFLVTGSAQGIHDGVTQTGMEVYDATVLIGTCDLFHPNGRSIVVGGASYVSIGTMMAKFTWQLVALGNDYITCVPGVTELESDARCVINSFNVIRSNNSAYVPSSRPTFEISKKVKKFGNLTTKNGKFENVNNGFTSQTDLFIYRCNSDASGVLSIENVKFTTIVTPIYCNTPDNLIQFIGNDFDNSKIYYQDGSMSNFGGRESPVGGYVPYFHGITLTSPFQYFGHVPVKIFFRLTTSASTSVLINGNEVLYFPNAGTYSFSDILNFSDTISLSSSGSVSTLGNRLTFVRNIY
ncbi:hypothetical protein PEC302107_36160 [Pectobacterium araliae]|uniref:hypothetical protein n=1 Tax=Pectobacterium araliae TaxID=3073862 RepID=UPI002084D9FA|nr:hypothetical protein PEC302107_36160 [Pectobacterium carotovorum subsp. carotovorum]